MTSWKVLCPIAVAIACYAQTSVDPKIQKLVVAACKRYQFTGGEVYRSTEQYLIVLNKEQSRENEVIRISKYFLLMPDSGILTPVDPGKLGGLGIDSPRLIFHTETKDPDFKFVGGVLGNPPHLPVKVYEQNR